MKLKPILTVSFFNGQQTYITPLTHFSYYADHPLKAKCNIELKPRVKRLKFVYIFFFIQVYSFCLSHK